MENLDDGGQAFPRAWDNHEGMSLRDYFAGQAIIALPHIGCGCDLPNEDIAAAAYQIADALIARRSKGK